MRKPKWVPEPESVVSNRCLETLEIGQTFTLDEYLASPKIRAVEIWKALAKAR